MLNLVFDLPNMEAERLLSYLASREDSLKLISWSEKEGGRQKKFDKITDLKKSLNQAWAAFGRKICLLALIGTKITHIFS